MVFRLSLVVLMIASALSMHPVFAQNGTLTANLDECFSVKPCPNVIAPKRVRVTVDPNLAALNTTADLYDPQGNRFAPVQAQMNVPRESYVAVMMRNGRVLFAGGRNASYLNSAEIFDPSTGAFVLTTKEVTNAAGDTEIEQSNLSYGRGSASAVLLQGGRVLIAGGFNGKYLSSAEIFDPGTGAFSTTGSMSSAREGFTMTLLPSTGKVLVAGGYNGDWLDSAELYDPSKGSFAYTDSMSVSRRNHTATMLADGKVLLTGGDSYDSSSSATTTEDSAELYDPSDDTFTDTGSMTVARTNHTATLLPNGKVLITGGIDSNGNILSSAEIYDPETGSFTATGSMSTPRAHHSALAVSGRKILIVGGVAGEGLSSAELFDLDHGTFTPISSSLSAPRFNITAIALNSGSVLLAGGLNASRLKFDTNDSVEDNISTNIVFSADSKTGFVSYSGSGTVVAFSVATGEILKRIHTGGVPAFITPLKDGNSLAVVSAWDNKIFVIGMDVLSVRATYTFPTAEFSWGSILTLSPDGSLGYISSTATGEVIKFRISDGSETGRVTGLQTPAQITVTPNGKTVMVVDTTPSEVCFIDSSTMSVNYKFAPLTDDEYEDDYPNTSFTIYNKLVLSPDGYSGIIASQDSNSTSKSTVFWLNISTGRIIDVEEVGYKAGYTTLTPDNKYWVILTQDSIALIPLTDFDSTMNISTVLGNDLGSANVVFSSDSKYMYYVSSTENYLFQQNVFQRNVESGREESRGVSGEILTGHDPSVSLDQSSSVAITPDGTTIGVLNFISDNIHLLTDQTILTETKFVSTATKFTLVSIVNLSNAPTNLILTALTDAGYQIQESSTNPYLVNPVSIQLGPNAQTAVELSQLFNFNLNSENVGQLVIAADQPHVSAFAVLGELQPSFFGAYLKRMDGLPFFKEPFDDLIVPEVINDTGTSVELTLLNRNFNNSSYEITAYGRDGSSVHTTSGSAGASTSTSQQASDLATTKDQDKVVLIGGLGCASSSMINTDGVITGIVVTTPGNGYTVPPIVTISAPDASDGTTATATAILNASGGVSAIVLTNGGKKYTEIPTVTITGPDSSGTQAVASAQMAKVCPSNNSLNQADSYDGSTNLLSAQSGSLATARDGHAAVEMQGGDILVTGGKSGTTILTTAEILDPSDGSIIVSAGSMSLERRRHTATLLRNGSILIAGGQTNSSVTDTAELYNPSDESFSPTAGKMTSPRDSHTATRLSDGTILIVGGLDGDGATSSAEIYDPSSSSFMATGSMSTGRIFHTAVALPDGRVLITGGYNGTYLQSAEIYDPNTGQFTQTTDMSEPRAYHACTLLDDGTVLITGGRNRGGVLSTAEIYDPASGLFIASGSQMTQARASHTATLMANNKVIIAGGTDGKYISNTVEMYDPASQSFILFSTTMTSARQGHTATSLEKGFDGYFRIDAPNGLMVSEIFNQRRSGSALLGINLTRYANTTSLYSPQFVIMQGYSSVLNLINANQDEAAQVTITLHKPDGSIIGEPVTRVLQINGQIKDDIANIFGNSPAVQNTVGWLEIQSSATQIVGTLTFSNPDGTFFAPYELSGVPWNQCVFPLAMQNDLYRTALAVLNSNAAAADVQVQLWGKDGTLLRSASVSLAPGTRIAQYLNELFPGLKSLDVGNVRIRSTQPLHGLALVHDNSLHFLISIPPVLFP